MVATPTTPGAAARRIAIGLTALFLLSPATRFGYFIYPIALCWWAVLSEADCVPDRGPARWNTGPFGIIALDVFDSHP
jgi:hypothetical protein